MVLAGVALPLAVIATALALAAPVNGLRRQKAAAWALAFLTAGILLAWAWHEVRAPAPSTAWASLPPREATLTIRIKRSFSAKAGSDYANGLAEVVQAPTVLGELQGRLVLYSVRMRSGESRPVRGEVVEVSGLLDYLPRLIPASSDPAEASAARFREYLHAQGAWFELTRGRLVRTVAPPSDWELWLETQHEKIKTILQNSPAGLTEDYGNVYAALLLGEPTLLTSDQRAALTLSGEIYLFAVSGLHIAVLAAMVWWPLRRTPGLPHRIGEVLVLGVAWLYVEITGQTPSGQRAALMLTCYVLAKWLNRASSPLGAVVAAGVATLLIDPRALDNAGFELSFGVVLGLILYAQPLREAILARWTPWRDIPAESHAPWQKCVVAGWEKLVAMSTSSWTAVLCSAALMAEFFGANSLHGLWLNLLFFPLTCVALGTGTWAVATGLVAMPPFTWVSWLVNAVSLLAVDAMNTLAHFVSRWAWLSPSLHITPVRAGSLATLAVLAWMLLAQPKGRQPRWWYFALPLAILAVFAIFCVRAV